MNVDKKRPFEPDHDRDSSENLTVDCGWVKESLNAFIDGELDSGEVCATEKHLDQCDTCRRLEWEIREMGEILAGMSSVTVGDREKFVRNVNRRVRADHRRSVYVHGLLGAAAAVILSTLAVVFMVFLEPSEPDDLIRDLPVLEDLNDELRDLEDSNLDGGLDPDLVDVLIAIVNDEETDDGDLDDLMDLLLEEEEDERSL